MTGCESAPALDPGKEFLEKDASRANPGIMPSQLFGTPCGDGVGAAAARFQVGGIAKTASAEPTVVAGIDQSKGLVGPLNDFLV